MPPFIDDIQPGQRYTHLLVVRVAPRSIRGDHMWLCRCDCGAEVVRKATHLRCGAIKSCGCLMTRLPRGQSGLNAVFAAYKRKAEKRGLTWTLTRDQLREIITRPCEYCGVEPSRRHSTAGTGPAAMRKAGPGMVWGAIVCNGIDRIDNAHGYELGNCAPCCWMCNRAKHQSTVEEFLAWGERLFLHQQFKRSHGRTTA
jgi:hypothetical protein